MMRVVITGGGTGGHLFPGIALAQGLRTQLPNSEILFIGTSRLLDQDTLAKSGFKLATLHCGGVKGLGLAAKLRSFFGLPRAIWQARRMLAEFKPNLVFGVGGYVTGPVLLAAKSLSIATAIHEQNSVPGLANRLAGKLVDRIFISIPCDPPFPPAKTIQTGNPVRESIILAGERQVKKRREQGERSKSQFCLLVLGGSQGAHAVNLLVTDAVRILVNKGVSLRVIHQSGKTDENEVRARYEQANLRAEVSAFIQDMAAAYESADFVISRAGATTLAELAIMGLPALLVPYPFAADNHQAKNGSYYARKGGCVVFEEHALSAEKMAEHLESLLHNPSYLQEMATGMRTMGEPQATEQLIKACLALAAQTIVAPPHENRREHV